MKKNTTIDMNDKEACGKIATKIAKARGFTGGEFTLINNTSKVAFTDGIHHKLVKGDIEVDTSEPLVLKRNYFTAEAWVDIISCMGFEFYNATDIESFTIQDGKVLISISISTDTLPNT